MPNALVRVFPWLLAACAAAGCIDRTRLNAACEWTRDSTFPLALANPADYRHLVADAQLAEGLAVRYADTEHKRRTGYGGHGRLLDYGRVLSRCYDTLVERIQRDHAVTAADIDQARAVRDASFDAPVALSFVALYVVAAAGVVRWIRRRFVDDGRVVHAAIVVGASAAASALGVQLGAVWGAIWECVRIGDDHFGSFRAAHPFWHQEIGAVFAGGVLVFWTIAILESVRGAAATEHAEASTSDG
jgi:hypothetical protein